MPNGHYLYSLDWSISKRKGVWLVIIMFCGFYFELNTIRVDPDQTLRFAASNLGLYYLPMSILWAARLKWVNIDFLHHENVPI